MSTCLDFSFQLSAFRISAFPMSRPSYEFSGSSRPSPRLVVRHSTLPAGGCPRHPLLSGEGRVRGMRFPLLRPSDLGLRISRRLGLTPAQARARGLRPLDSLAAFSASPLAGRATISRMGLRPRPARTSQPWTRPPVRNPFAPFVGQPSTLNSQPCWGLPPSRLPVRHSLHRLS